MKTFDITITKTITQEEIDDILATAFEGGIAHWCDGIRILEPAVEKGVKYFSDVLTRGGTLALHDIEEYVPSTGTYGKWHKLDLPMLLRALEDKPFNVDNYDAADADILVQRAIFGEYVYA